MGLAGQTPLGEICGMAEMHTIAFSREFLGFRVCSPSRVFPSILPQK